MIFSKQPDPEKLISFLAGKNVAKFKGHGIEVEFYQELPDFNIPVPVQDDDEEMVRQYNTTEEAL